MKAPKLTFDAWQTVVAELQAVREATENPERREGIDRLIRRLQVEWVNAR